ncbi:MAG: Uma2 family endonuclease, partial [Fimbriiglobus sp.]
MATATLVSVPVSALARPPQRLFTVAEYHRMGAAGVLTENSRCELIHGVILEKPVIHPAHKKAVRHLIEAASAVFGKSYVIDSQGPITLPDSEPEPDLSVAVGPEEQYDARNPLPPELVLVVEVADSSLDYDRGEKLEMYAASQIAVYWIVNFPDRRVEVYTDPHSGKSPTYRTRTDYAPGESVPVTVAGTILGTIP